MADPPASRTRRRWSMLRAGGFGGRVLSMLALVMVIVGASAWISHTRMVELETRLVSLHEDRVIPLRDLKMLSDLYAVHAVDTVHKLCAGRLSASVGAATLTETLQQADELYQRIRARGHDNETLDQQVVVARMCVEEAQQLASRGDLTALSAWREHGLYPRIDPLTATLGRTVDREVEAVDTMVAETHRRLATLTNESRLMLLVSMLVALVLGAWLTRDVLDRLQHVADTVEKAAGGDLLARVDPRGTDELAALGRGVDQMIDAVATAQRELRKQARSLAASEREAQAANQAKSLFLSSMSHELRTPLNVILGHAQILHREHAADEAIALSVVRIREAGTHLLALIDDVLSLARLESHRIELQEAPFDPREVLDEVTRMLSVPAQAKPIRLQARVEGELPEAVLGDRRRLIQILLNLGGNAIKFTQQGHVTLTMRFAQEQLMVSVQDTGPGIAADEQLRLFEGFHQGASGVASAQGSGLGLYISRQLARLMGGDVTLDSQLGHGATFTLSVGAKPTRRTAGAVASMQPIHVVSTGNVGPQLVVDDRATNREVLGALLRSSGFEVDELDSGARALEAYRSKLYSLVWLDIRMPEMDGFEVIRRLREIDEARGRRTPVVAITASIVDFTEAQARAVGFDALAAKPFQDDTILALMAELLPIQIERRAIGSSPPTDDDVASPLATLSTSEAAQLLHLLRLGDHDAAIAWLREHGGERMSAVVRRIATFRADSVIDALVASTTKEGTHTP